jgi:hypothetical protein
LKAKTREIERKRDTEGRYVESGGMEGWKDGRIEG